MTEQHPITPPPELLQQWGHDANLAGVPWNDTNWNYERFIASCAAQWGADQELEACCEWLHWQNLATHPEMIPSLRAARRPKPPSLKQQALDAFEVIKLEGDFARVDLKYSDWVIIRQALEQLDD